MLRLWRPFRIAVRCKPTLSKLSQSDKTLYDFVEFEHKKLLPFNDIRHSETFGQLVVSENLRQTDQLNDTSSVVIDAEERSPFRNADGSYIRGTNAEEARLDPKTLHARVDRLVVRLPHEVAKAINKNILSLTVPDKLRERCAVIYQSLSKEQIQQVPESSLDCDAHIAALFLQNYSHAWQVLTELKHRVEDFNPRRVLDVGYGPATGMVALNEVMGPEWIPDEKDVYVVGRRNNEMKKRAKIILSRQRNENVEEVEQDGKEDVEVKEEPQAPPSPDYIGPVDVSRIKIHSKLRDTLPVDKKYDLIMVNQSLLTREYNFPRDVDENMHMLLRLLSPGGHIVLIERGNALGFETITRARQVMIRPESYGDEKVKIPRPYIRGSSLKPQRLKHEDRMVNEEDIEYEEHMLAKMEEEIHELEGEAEEDLEAELNAKYGEVSEEELKFEFEDSDEVELHELSSESVDYHLSIVAPCSHHHKCPLQLGDPKYYKIPAHKHRLSFCTFHKTVERPKYTMELKKGRRLAVAWDKSAEDGFGTDKLSKGTLKKLGGLGRPGSNNTETGSYSYVIAQRSPNDVDTIRKIESQREIADELEVDPEDPGHWPRVIANPTKIKKNVKLTVSAPSGNIEVWQVPKSLGKQVYHDVRKVARGDLWPHGKKSAVVKAQLLEKARDKLDVLAKTQKKTFLKEQRKKQWKKVLSRDEADFEHDIVTLADSLASNLEQSKQYRQKGKRAKFDVDPRLYDGK